ncbi:hypothetical protein P0E69_06925 [Chimaeribacter arupi]|uniref:hypothetical protein n=1 Tax=Chimaeribacter arupi TaxID=2060066 RepID=UPI000C7AD0D3|nr:hypothetical protein [Chimaeribacter arupi]PLR52422.1 hypothetical protein CYR52_07645 [Chimaeribacter arupi]WKZ93622.1 hypothetical protein P0E69_06925 [Chimaeribacter arupi]
MAEYLAAGAAGLGALSNINSARDASKQSNLNAKLLDQQTRNVALQTGSQVSQIRRQGDQVLAQQSAGFADNGTGTGGSNALIQRSTAIDTEMDAANADYNGRLQVSDLQNQASALRAQAKAQKPGLLSYLGGAVSTLSAYSKAGGTFGGSSSKK